MYNKKTWVIGLFVVMITCGCQNTNTKEAVSGQPKVVESVDEINVVAENTGKKEISHTSNLIPDEDYLSVASNEPNYDDIVTITGRKFSIKEINEGIKNAFNSQLYYEGDYGSDYIYANKNLVLNKDIEYELYYLRLGENSDDYTIAHIIVKTTELLHPETLEKYPRFYSIRIGINKYGLKSKFDYVSYTTADRYNSDPDFIYLGTYTLRLDEIVKPQEEIMDEEWVENAKTEIRNFMDDLPKREFWEQLEPGNYKIYVQKFIRSDKDSSVIFEHENGDLYKSSWDNVHEMPDNCFIDEPYSFQNFKGDLAYAEKVKADPAVSLEYYIK